MGIYIQKFPLEQYKQLEPERLDRVDEGEFMSLFVLPKDLGNIACRLVVVVEGITPSEDGRQRFGLHFTNQDLQIVTNKPHKATLTDRYWRPERSLPMMGKSMNTEATTGYFMPYETDVDGDWLDESADFEAELQQLQEQYGLVPAQLGPHEQPQTPH